MAFEEFLVGDSKNNKNNDILDNIAEMQQIPTSNMEHYEGEIRPYMFEPGWVWSIDTILIIMTKFNIIKSKVFIPGYLTAK